MGWWVGWRSVVKYKAWTRAVGRVYELRVNETFLLIMGDNLRLRYELHPRCEVAYHDFAVQGHVSTNLDDKQEE